MTKIIVFKQFILLFVKTSKQSDNMLSIHQNIIFFPSTFTLKIITYELLVSNPENILQRKKMFCGVKNKI